jgi:hypothetical protein
MPRALPLEDSPGFDWCPEEVAGDKKKTGSGIRTETATTVVSPNVNVTMPEPAPPIAKPFYETVMAQMLAVLAALTIFCTIITLAHFFLIRRYGTSIFPLFRVEVVAQPPEVREGPPPANYPGFGAPPERAQKSFDELFPPPEEEAPIQPNFEIGPTYEEERALREEAERQREAAVLQHIVDLNRQLQEELRQTQPADEAPTHLEPPPDELISDATEEPDWMPLDDEAR